jgi:hypothetical protein
MRRTNANPFTQDVRAQLIKQLSPDARLVHTGSLVKKVLLSTTSGQSVCVCVWGTVVSHLCVLQAHLAQSCGVIFI